MDKLFTVAQVIVPIFAAVALGVLARHKKLLTQEENQGLLQFVMKFGLPCVIFNSCLTADIKAESFGTMILVLPFLLASTLWAFRARKIKFPYHNLPQMFDAKETGMLGIPLFMILFGADQAYRIGVLDITQGIVVFPTLAILSANAGENPAPGTIAKKVLTSPLLIMSVLGLGLNLIGVGAWMNTAPIGKVVIESTAFLAQPVSAMMIFSVGYNFSLAKSNRAIIFRLSAMHFLWFALSGGLIQLALFLIPHVDALSRWAILLYTTLPASYLAPGMGKSREDVTVASGVCSVLTVTNLIVFCIIAMIVA